LTSIAWIALRLKHWKPTRKLRISKRLFKRERESEKRFVLADLGLTLFRTSLLAATQRPVALQRTGNGIIRPGVHVAQKAAARPMARPSSWGERKRYKTI
jgi:hypothetical protein